MPWSTHLNLHYEVSLNKSSRLFLYHLLNKPSFCLCKTGENTCLVLPLFFPFKTLIHIQTLLWRETFFSLVLCRLADLGSVQKGKKVLKSFLYRHFISPNLFFKICHLIRRKQKAQNTRYHLSWGSLHSFLFLLLDRRPEIVIVNEQHITIKEKENKCYEIKRKNEPLDLDWWGTVYLLLSHPWERIRKQKWKKSGQKKKNRQSCFNFIHSCFGSGSKFE